MGQGQSSSSPPLCDVKDPQSYQCLEAKINETPLPAGCERFQKTCAPCLEKAQGNANANMNCFLRSEDQNLYQKVLCIQKAAAGANDLNDILVANAGMNCLLGDKDQDILYIAATGRNPPHQQKQDRSPPKQQHPQETHQSKSQNPPTKAAPPNKSNTPATKKATKTILM